MVLKKGSIQEFAQNVTSTQSKIIIYGAGVIGQTVAPYWLCRYQLENNVLCYVDADSHKQRQTISLGTHEIPIRSLSALEEERNYCLLVTVSAFEPIVQALGPILATRKIEVYFLPIMLLDMAHRPKMDCVVKSSEVPLIPKTIHYCWFSGNPIPKELQKCIDSWKQFCPDYDLIRWDESNYDIHKCLYTEQAYAHKKWGFVSDFARFDILYQYGGIYLDTDVELLRNLDALLYQPAFCGVEKWGVINSGGCSGSQPGNPVISEIIAFRKHIRLIREDGSINLTSSGEYDTKPLIKLGLKVDGTTQSIADGMMTVYSSDFFHPFDYMSGETMITENTFSIHHFSGSWLGAGAADERIRTRQHYRDFIARLEE